MIAIEIEEDLIFDDFRNPALTDKLFPDAEITLLHVREIQIDDQLDLVIHLVFEDILDGRIIQFRHLHDSMSDFPSFAVPVGDKVFSLIHIPLIKVIMVLNPVFTEFSDHILTK